MYEDFIYLFFPDCKNGWRHSCKFFCVLIGYTTTSISSNAQK